MATLVLTVVGGILGGPIGAAIGGIAGQAIDQRLLAPKARSGPRLADLAVQTSTYGAQIPRIFGRARVAGSVIWATDLEERRERKKAGKGQPKQTVYSYAANFAVALSARPVARIGRIWADGNLLRGEAGDFKTPTGFRFYSGSEDQPVDPLIASAEGSGQAPAYRGLAYVVFEDFQLGDYGNRIPSLSFEVIADEGDVALGPIITELGDDRIEADLPMLVSGLVANGSSLRALIESLEPYFAMHLTETGQGLRLTGPLPAVTTLSSDALGASANASKVTAIQQDRGPARQRPSRVSLAYSDTERDYQPGLQRAWQGGANDKTASESELALAPPLILSPTVAGSLATRAMDHASAAGDRAHISLPWRYSDLRPGQRLSLPESPGEWVIDASQLEAMVVRLDLVRFRDWSFAGPIGEPGRNVASPDLVHGPTTLHLLDLPWLEEGAAATPSLIAVASGFSPGWRRAALSISSDDGLTWQDAGFTAAPATIGTAETVLPVASSLIIDRANSLDVTLLRPDMVLLSTNTAGLASGANLALVGDELIQFETAVLLVPGQYRLSGLIRGCRGTEWAIANHIANECFILIEQETAALVPIAGSGSNVQGMAIGLGDDDAVLVGPVGARAALLPPSPVYVRSQPQIDGSIAVSWIRRSRSGWHWTDLIDSPLVEQEERYRILVAPPGLPIRSFEVQQPNWTYASTDRTADAAAGATHVLISIEQLGTFGPSRPTAFTISLT